MYMDTSDLFDQSQAMRTFHTLQSSRVPNDLDGYKKWLAKGLDEPDYSSTAPARHAKILNEGHVVAKGSMRDLSNTIAKPTGTTPSSAPLAEDVVPDATVESVAASLEANFVHAIAFTSWMCFRERRRVKCLYSGEPRSGSPDLVQA